MTLAIVVMVIQVVLIIHVLKTGRQFFWIFLLIFVPGVGSLIYLVVEILPSITSGLAARRAMRSIGGVVDPGRDLRQRALEYDRSRNVDTATRLAGELIRDGKHDEAIQVCEEARSGVFEDDPKLLLTLATAHFGKGAAKTAIEMLDALRAKNPRFRSPEGHLLYARALEQDGQTGRAIEEYEALARYYPGAEARVRLAQLHARTGNVELAREMFKRIVEDARLAPKHFQKAQREWIDVAKKGLS